MKKHIYILLAILFTACICNGQSIVNHDINTGVELYSQDKYSTALDAFNKILYDGRESAILYYNIGNVHAKLKNNAEAIWAYEKALKLNPQLEEAKLNLHQLNKEIDNEIIHIKPFFLLKWWDVIIKIFSPNTWAILCLISIILYICLMCFKWLSVYPVSHKYLISTFIFWLVLLIIASSSFYDFEDHSKAIIMQDEISLHIGADERSDKIIDLPAGLKVIILDQIDDWLKIQLPDLSIGWVSQDDARRI